MALITVKTSGGDYDSVAEAVAAATGSGDAARPQIIDIYDGTYTESDTIVLAAGKNNVTIQGNSGDATAVIITNTTQRQMWHLGRTTSGTIIQNVTSYHNKNSQTNTMFYGALPSPSSSAPYARFTIRDCILQCKENGIRYWGTGSLVERCVIERIAGGSANQIWAFYATPHAKVSEGHAGLEGGIQVDACLFKYWYDYGMYVTNGNTVVRNCTFIGGTSTDDDAFRLTGLNNKIYNTIVYSNPADRLDTGFRFGLANATNLIKNCISFGGATTDYTNCGSPTVGLSTWKDDGDVDTDGNDIFIAGLRAGGSGSSYHPHADGLAYQNGTTDSFPQYDLSGSAFNASSPSIGCYEAVVTGLSLIHI